MHLLRAARLLYIDIDIDIDICIYIYTAHRASTGLTRDILLFRGFSVVHELITSFANTPFVWAPHYPPSCIAHTLLRSILAPPPDPPSLQYSMPDDISNGNIA